MTTETGEKSSYKQLIKDLYHWKLNEKQEMVNSEASDSLVAFLREVTALLSSAPDESLELETENYLSRSKTSKLAQEIPTLNEIAKLVDGLFEYFSDERRMIKTFFSLTLKLKPLFFKLAVLDYRLLSGEEEIGKLLLNQLAIVGSSLSDNSPLTKEVESIVNSLQKSTSSVCELKKLNKEMELVHRQLDTLLTGVEKKARIFEKRSREIALGQSKANAAKNWVNNNINDLVSAFNLPDYIKAFIQESFQHILFLEKLKESDDTPVDCMALLKNLALSFNQVESEPELKFLAELQAETLKSLKPELSKTNLVEIEINALMRNIEDDFKKTLIHSKSIIKENSKEEILRLMPKSLLEPDPEIEEPDSPEPIVDSSLAEWINRQVKQKMSSTRDYNQDTTVNSEKTSESTSLSELSSWNTGDWFDLNVDNTQNRCKLASVIEESEVYIFVDFQGVKVLESNRNDLLEFVDSKKIKKVKGRPNFESALKSTLNKTLMEQQEKFEEEKRLAEKTKQEELERRQKALAKEQERLRQEAKRKAAVEKAASSLNSLSVGSWVEIELHGKKKKCRFAARIASSNKYIFTDRSGIKLFESSLEELAIMVVDNKIDLTIDNGLFGQALAAVISNRRGTPN